MSSPGAGSVPVPTTAIRASIEEALGTWTAVAPLQFTEVSDFGPPVSDLPYPGPGCPELRFGHHAIAKASNFDLAHTQCPTWENFLFTGGLTGDAHFDDAHLWDPNQLTFVAAREVGHAVGLGDANTSSLSPTPAIMDKYNGAMFIAPGASFLRPDDVRGIRANYGAGLGWVLDSSGILHVNGTVGGDLITISSSGGNVTVTSAGNGTFTRTLAGVTGISVMARAGDDTINVLSLPGSIPLTITGDTGDDTLNLFPAAIGSRVSFDGGAGNDSIAVSDVGSPASFTYGVNSSNVFRTGWAGAGYSNVSSIRLSGAGGPCTYAVDGLPRSCTLSIFDGGAADVLDLAPAPRNLDFIQGGVIFAAAGAGNSVRASDQFAAGNPAMTLTSNAVTRPSFGGATWSGAVSTVTLLAGIGNNDIDIQSTNASDVLVSTGAGDDRVRLSPYTGFVNAIAARVFVEGGAGTDTVTANDSMAGFGSDSDWTLNSTGLFKTLAPRIAVASWAPGSVENVIVAGGTTGTRFNVESLPAGMTASIYAGGGDDTFEVGSCLAGFRNVDAIQGALSLNGEGGTNTLNYRDDDNGYVRPTIWRSGWFSPPPPHGDAYTLTGSYVRRDRSATVNYSNVQTANVFGGTAANDFYVTPAAGTAMYLNGNSPTPPNAGVSEWDRITVDYGNTTNPVLTYSVYGGAGTYSFADRAPVKYTDMESNNAPPTVVYAAPIYFASPDPFGTTPIRLQVL